MRREGASTELQQSCNRAAIEMAEVEELKGR